MWLGRRGLVSRGTSAWLLTPSRRPRLVPGALVTYRIAIDSARNPTGKDQE
jgi:hypothetical protein